MGKPYAVAAIVTLVVASVYILYITSVLPEPVMALLRPLLR
jgi:hypothetical protein